VKYADADEFKAALDQMQADKRADSMRIWLGQELSTSKGDHFKFRTDHAYAIKDLGDGEPCARVIVAVEIGRHDFHLYEVDLAMQNKENHTHETRGHDLLNFAEVENPHIHTLCPEYIIADKATLYLKENGNEDFERVNDIAHAALLIENINLDLERLTEGLAQYAIQRDVVDELLEKIPDAPDDWQDKFQDAMEQSKSDLTLSEAMDMIRGTIDLVRGRAYDVALERYDESSRETRSESDEHSTFSERDVLDINRVVDDRESQNNLAGDDINTVLFGQNPEAMIVEHDKFPEERRMDAWEREAFKPQLIKEQKDRPDQEMERELGDDEERESEIAEQPKLSPEQLMQQQVQLQQIQLQQIQQTNLQQRRPKSVQGQGARAGKRRRA
jgi:hypothetical protein